MEYNTQKIRLRFFQEIVYQAEGVEKHLMLDGDRKCYTNFFVPSITFG